MCHVKGACSRVYVYICARLFIMHACARASVRSCVDVLSVRVLLFVRARRGILETINPPTEIAYRYVICVMQHRQPGSCLPSVCHRRCRKMKNVCVTKYKKEYTTTEFKTNLRPVESFLFS